MRKRAFWFSASTTGIWEVLQSELKHQYRTLLNTCDKNTAQNCAGTNKANFILTQRVTEFGKTFFAPVVNSTGFTECSMPLNTALIDYSGMENKPDPLQIAKGTAAKQPVFSQRPDAPEAPKHYEL